MARIIAEICQNHNGDRTLLKEMISAARESGADIIKGQIIFSEDLTHRERFDLGFEEDNGVRKTIRRPYQAEFERLRGLDFAEDDYRFFVEEVNRAGAIPMLTVFSRGRIPLAVSLPWLGERHVKIASYDCASFVLLDETARFFDSLVISTGATFDEEVRETARRLRERNKRFAFLHCVTSYPNTLAMANLSRLEWLRQLTPEVGWSDHTVVARDGIKASKVALALGADYIERHFTLLPPERTKDGPISVTPALLRELAAFAKLPREEQRARIEEEIPDWRLMLGNPQREMTHTEMLNRDYYRGRFASRVNGEWVHNWEEKTVLPEKKVLAVIPARGGSKGVPKKNIKLFLGKPLVVHSIEVAKRSRYIQRIIVSTDSEEIARVAREYGAEVPFLRPAELAEDLTPDAPVFEHCLLWLKEHEGYVPDIVVHLRPTGPLRTAEELDEAIEMFERNPDADSVRSVEEPPKPPFKMWEMDGLYMKPFVADIPGIRDFHTAPRQLLPKVYQTTADIGVVRPSVILDKKSVIGDKVLPYMLKRPTVDIDMDIDFEIGELLLRKQINGS